MTFLPYKILFKNKYFPCVITLKTKPGAHLFYYRFYSSSSPISTDNFDWSMASSEIISPLPAIKPLCYTWVVSLHNLTKESLVTAWNNLISTIKSLLTKDSLESCSLRIVLFKQTAISSVLSSDDFIKLDTLFSSLLPILSVYRDHKSFVNIQHPDVSKRFAALHSFIETYSKNIESTTSHSSSHVSVAEFHYFIKSTCPSFISYNIKNFSGKMVFTGATSYCNTTAEVIQNILENKKKIKVIKNKKEKEEKEEKEEEEEEE